MIKGQPRQQSVCYTYPNV